MFLNAAPVFQISINNQLDECHQWKQTFPLTTQLVDLINLSEYHQDRSKVLLDKLLCPSTIEELINQLENIEDSEVFNNVIVILRFILDSKKGGDTRDLSDTQLWKKLFELALTPHEFIPRDSYHSILETLVQYFKNKCHVIAACETPEDSKILARYLTELLFSKNEKTKHEKNKKTAQKRRKAGASIISSISRHKEGQELIKDAGLIERLHSYLLQISTDKNCDALVHKIGQTILRCIPLRNLHGLTDTYSAYVYRSFGTLPGALEGVGSSDSSEESEDEDDKSDQSSCDEDDEPIICSASSHRSQEELEQYGRIIEDKKETVTNDELVKLCESASLGYSRSQVYEAVTQRIKSVQGFQLIPCPDWANASGNYENEKLYTKDRRVCRNKLLKTLGMAMNPDGYKPKLVYDLDSCLLNPDANSTLKMVDVEAVSRTLTSPDTSLNFESRFESGNLRKAYQVGEREYDLILNSDVNSTGRQQWFYFRVAGGIRAAVSYTFNILNFEKQRNIFNQGMKPVVFSVKEYIKSGQAVWKRSGSEICYYRNVFRRGTNNQPYWTLSFDITFPFDNDVVYLAYHYPYTYSQLLTDIIFWQREYQNTPKSRLKVSSLCSSPCGNPVPVLWLRRSDELRKASVSFVSARVHPGESCASWCLRGFVQAALNDKQSTYGNRIRKCPSLCIVPMLNVDGTIHGCARTEVTNEDLNRKWLKPEKRHPSIYHSKGLIEFIRRATGTNPVVLCDMHGHSRRFNAFLYGCQSTENDQKGTRLMPATCQPSKEGEEDAAHTLPIFVQVLKSKIPEYLDISQCSWKMEESRDSTARIVGWRHLGFQNSYTLECSMGGYQQTHTEEWIHFNTARYNAIGSAVYKTIQHISELP